MRSFAQTCSKCNKLHPFSVPIQAYDKYVKDQSPINIDAIIHYLNNSDQKRIKQKRCATCIKED